LSGFTLAAQVSFARNESSFTDRSFSSWEIGPVLKWVFGRALGVETVRFRQLGILLRIPTAVEVE
jgi:hypothetical protein